jgi:hypothetical protein
MHSIVTAALGPKADGLNFDAIYEAAALAYLELVEPADKLDDLKKRARAALEAKRDREIGPPSVEESNARRAREAAALVPMTPV